jgi:TRAP-type C4-dicarboxylate transport system substrate-binding protein
MLVLVSLFVSINANKKAERLSLENSRLANGNIELEIRNMIMASNTQLTNAINSLTPLAAKKKTGSLSAEEQEILTILQQQYQAAQENYINAYEEACAKYLDNKMDKVRFKKTYNIELRNIVNELKQYFDSVSSPYTAIKKVYNEWENNE